MVILCELCLGLVILLWTDSPWIWFLTISSYISLNLASPLISSFSWSIGLSEWALLFFLLNWPWLLSRVESSASCISISKKPVWCVATWLSLWISWFSLFSFLLISVSFCYWYLKRLTTISLYNLSNSSNSFSLFFFWNNCCYCSSPWSIWSLKSVRRFTFFDCSLDLTGIEATGTFKCVASFFKVKFLTRSSYS